MPPEQAEFQALMERIRSGSQDAVRELLHKYGIHILRVVRRHLNKKLRSQYDSCDFVQAVWASFFTNSLQEHSFSRPEDLIGFLVKVAGNKVIDAFRQRMRAEKNNINREHSLEGSAAGEAVKLLDTQPSPSQLAMANEKLEQLQQRARRPGFVILELLRQGVSHVEIARRLKINEKTVRRLVRNVAPKEWEQDCNQ
jgi:RNA polymerase sigma factor (sigma-70 family)